MRPGIVTAMTSEALTLSAVRVPAGRVIALRGGALMTLGGIGRSRASAACGLLLRSGADALISWGGASGLDPGMRPGALVIPERILSAAGSVQSSDPELYRRIRSALDGRFSHARGLLSESGRILKAAADKNDLFRQTGALAADMESAAVAEAARAAGVPFLSIRAVIDPSETALPDSAVLSIDDWGDVRPTRFLRLVAGRPADIPALFRLARHFRRARSILTQVGACLSGSGCFDGDEK